MQLVDVYTQLHKVVCYAKFLIAMPEKGYQPWARTRAMVGQELLVSAIH